MKIRCYKNFDDLFYSFNRELLLEPMFDYVYSAIGYVDNVMFKCDTYDCTLNISDVGYKKNKWTNYSASMVDKDSYEEFKQECQNSKSTCCIFNFALKGLTKGGSLLCIVLKRHGFKGKWKSCNVFVRTTEINRSFAVDLVLTSVFLKGLPKCDLDEINIFCAQTYIAAVKTIPLLEYFDVGLEELDDTTPFVKCMKNAKKTYYTDKKKLSNYCGVKNLQKMYFEDKEAPEIRVLDLEIGETPK